MKRRWLKRLLELVMTTAAAAAVLAVKSAHLDRLSHQQSGGHFGWRKLAAAVLPLSLLAHCLPGKCKSAAAAAAVVACLTPEMYLS